MEMKIYPSLHIKHSIENESLKYLKVITMTVKLYKELLFDEEYCKTLQKYEFKGSGLFLERLLPSKKPLLWQSFSSGFVVHSPNDLCFISGCSK